MKILRCLIVVFAGLAAHPPLGAVVDQTRATAALENASGPSAEPALAAPQPDAAPAPVPQKAAPRGNPLWAIPLRSLAATRDRPLFSASRRPPAPVIAAAPAPPAAAPMPAAVKPAEPERPPMTLIGTIVSADERIAIVLNETTKSVTRLREGEEDSGWRVRTVLARSAVVEKGAQSVTLGLPKPGDEPPPGAAPVEMPGLPRPANDSEM